MVKQHKDTGSNYSNLKYRHAYMTCVLIIEKTICSVSIPRTTLTKLTLRLFSMGRVLQLFAMIEFRKRQRKHKEQKKSQRWEHCTIWNKENISQKYAGGDCVIFVPSKHCSVPGHSGRLSV